MAVGLFALACSSAPKEPGSNDNAVGGAGVGTGVGTAGTAGAVTDGAPVNLDCPEFVGPLDGPYAPRDVCCRRASNSARNDALGVSATTGAREFRVNYALTTNHPKTLGVETVVGATINRYETEAQSLLFRFEGPRANGEVASGPGKSTIGQGRYNCDGTYSYYGQNAAPTSGALSTDPARWAPATVSTAIDATKIDLERTKPVWAETRRGFSYTPYLAADFTLDWELVTQSFNFLDFPSEGIAEDCVGSRTPTGWQAGGHYEVFSPLEPNDSDIIDTLMQTFCELLAFGGGQPRDAMHSCKDTPRCVPGSTGCTWQKLPDSLCPTTDAEIAAWACHVGDVNNEDGVETNCTPEAPTMTLDPDMGATTQGQCCDPLGTSTTLPKCNAWRLENEFVAAAAEITDAPVDQQQQNCQMQ